MGREQITFTKSPRMCGHYTLLRKILVGNSHVTLCSEPQLKLIPGLLKSLESAQELTWECFDFSLRLIWKYEWPMMRHRGVIKGVDVNKKLTGKTWHFPANFESKLSAFRVALYCTLPNYEASLIIINLIEFNQKAFPFCAFHYYFKHVDICKFSLNSWG